MQVILQQTVPNVGLVGDVVEVKPGFYRNYLNPRNLAVVASAGSVKQIAHQKKMIEAKKIKEKGIAINLKGRIESTPLTISHAAGEGEKLYGSITSQEIVLLMKEAGFVIDKKQLQIEHPIKTIGDHIVSVKLHPDVLATIKITVSKKETEKKEADKKEPEKTEAPKAAEAV